MKRFVYGRNKKEREIITNANLGRGISASGLWVPSVLIGERPGEHAYDDEDEFSIGGEAQVMSLK